MCGKDRLPIRPLPSGDDVKPEHGVSDPMGRDRTRETEPAQPHTSVGECSDKGGNGLGMHCGKASGGDQQYPCRDSARRDSARQRIFCKSPKTTPERQFFHYRRHQGRTEKTDSDPTSRECSGRRRKRGFHHQTARGIGRNQVEPHAIDGASSQYGQLKP